MKLLFSKKGDGNELLLNTLLIVIILGIIGTLITLFLLNFSNSTFMERNFLARDIALTIDTVLASPNDIVIYYPNPILEFHTVISKEKNRVEISLIEDKKLKYSTKYYFINNPTSPLNNFEYPHKEQLEKSLKPYHLIFEKKEDSLKIMDGEGYIQKEITTPTDKKYDVDNTVITKMDDWRNNAKIYIDVPSYFDPSSQDSKGSYSEEKDAYECNAVETVYKGLIDVELSKEDICKKLDVSARLSNMQDSNLIIVLRKSIEDKELNQAKIYYANNKESEKFAAILANNLLTKNVPKTQITIQKIENNPMDEDKQILQDKIGIVFYAGNINSETKGLTQSSSAMSNAIKEYYEN